MAGPEQEAVALLSGTGMGPVLAAALSPAGLSVQRWTRRRVHHRPGAGVTAVFSDHVDRVLAALAPVAASRLPVGSSSSTNAGRLAKARAIATRWRSPPDSSDGL